MGDKPLKKQLWKLLLGKLGNLYYYQLTLNAEFKIDVQWIA